MRFSELLAALLIIACPATLAAEAPEVEASREAAKRHNESIELSEERLERAIARAKAAHAEAVIEAKERMIEDLRRAFRTAMRSDAPENSVKIANQIDRLKNQVAEYQAAVKAGAEKLQKREQPRPTLEGLDPALVGVLHIYRDNKSRYRTYQVFGDGRVKVVADMRSDGEGSDLGHTYQGAIVDGKLLVHLDQWTSGGYKRGWVQAFKISDDGRLECSEILKHHYDKNGGSFGGELSRHWHLPYSESHFESVSELRAFLRKADDNVPDDPEISREDTTEPDSATDETSGTQGADDDDAGFFGIPLK